MTSILTNVAAMAALQTLRAIDGNMEETQARVSSGLRVGTASDNAAYWSIATTMRSDNMALSAVQDALGLGAAKVDTAYAAMESAVQVVKEIKAKMVAATEEGVDRAKIHEEIEQLQEQLRSIASAASFSGENWMQADLTNVTGNVVQKNVVGSFIRSESGAVSVKKIYYDLTGNTVLFDEGGDLGILDRIFNVTPASITLDVNVNGATAKYTVRSYTTEALIASGATFQANYANTTTPAGDYVKVQGVWVRAVNATTVPGQEIAATSTVPAANSWAIDLAPIPAGTLVEAPDSLDAVDITDLTNEELDVMVQATDVALEAMISATADLGSIAMRIEMQEEFIAALTDSIDSGIGRLVDADMNEESTRLKALQTQQQLAIQSLSIANTASENILTLFRQ
nr:Flagellin D [Rhizobium sp. Khangiran2]